ncbi:MAG: hypothetical protein HFH35_07585 [Eubacterium sp.]|nr:hypothetical protein [Eubacterium sp.]
MKKNRQQYDLKKEMEKSEQKFESLVHCCGIFFWIVVIFDTVVNHNVTIMSYLAIPSVIGIILYYLFE